MTLDRFTCVALGASIVVGTTTLYLSYRMNCTLMREVTLLAEVVSDIRKEIAEMKALLTRRKPGIAYSLSDEADVYYDFSDEGDDENNIIQDNHINSCSEEQILFQVDKLMENIRSNCDNSATYYQDILLLKNKFFNNPEYLWRLAKATHTYADVVGEQGDKTKKQQLAYEALKITSTALALTDDSANVHKWYAICLGSVGEYETVQNKIKNGFTFKEHTLLAMRLNPSDDSLHHLLGRWCYEVAQLSWIERKVATALYGEVPGASLEEARNHFLEAETLRQQGVWHENRLFIAKTYIGEGQYANAVKWLAKASETEDYEKVETVVAAEVAELKKRYAGYGRV